MGMKWDHHQPLYASFARTGRMNIPCEEFDYRTCDGCYELDLEVRGEPGTFVAFSYATCKEALPLNAAMKGT